MNSKKEEEWIVIRFDKKTKKSKFPDCNFYFWDGWDWVQSIDKAYIFQKYSETIGAMIHDIPDKNKLYYYQGFKQKQYAIYSLKKSDYIEASAVNWKGWLNIL